MVLLSEFFRAVVSAGLPLMALTFAVICWALYRGNVRGESVGELQASIASLAAQQKAGKKEKKERKKQLKARQEAGSGLPAAESGWEAEPQGKGSPDQAAEKLDPVLGKWFSFGGGFYGLVALYTWLLIEWDEAWGFVTDLPGILFSFNIGALIQVVINFFIESLMNFITAIAWPAYWLSSAINPWVWILVAYGGYWLGIKAAQMATGKAWLGESPDLAETIARPGDHDDDEGRP